MSWLGEQFSSFTEKISDFTKEMLPDSGTNSSDGMLENKSRIFFLIHKILNYLGHRHIITGYIEVYLVK